MNNVFAYHTKGATVWNAKRSFKWEFHFQKLSLKFVYIEANLYNHSHFGGLDTQLYGEHFVVFFTLRDLTEF